MSLLNYDNLPFSAIHFVKAIPVATKENGNDNERCRVRHYRRLHFLMRVQQQRKANLSP